MEKKCNDINLSLEEQNFLLKMLGTTDVNTLKNILTSGQLKNQFFKPDNLSAIGFAITFKICKN